MKRYTFVFRVHPDVTVEAETEDDATSIAQQQMEAEGVDTSDDRDELLWVKEE